MAKFEVNVEETLSRVVTVEAETMADAIELVHKQYHNEEIVLDSSDYADTKIEPESDYSEQIAEMVSKEEQLDLFEDNA